MHLICVEVKKCKSLTIRGMTIRWDTDVNEVAVGDKGKNYSWFECIRVIERKGLVILMLQHIPLLINLRNSS